MAVGALQASVACPLLLVVVEPEEPLLLDEEPVVDPVDPELDVGPDEVLEALAAGELEPEPPPQPERTSTTAATPQNVFNVFSDGKRISSDP